VTPSGPGPHGYVLTSVPAPGTTARTAQVETTPNPVRESTEIHYRIADSEPIRLAIVDATGREARVLTADAQTPGDHTLCGMGDTPTAPPPCRVSTSRS
jgi:hypothetical protein